MIVKDVYQSGINVLINGLQALMDASGTDDIPNYGAKSNTMFDHCQITFLVSDIRGVELITLRSLASSVKVLTKSPFTSPKKLRPTIFSNEYPDVSGTAEYQRFANATSSIVQKNLSLLDGFSNGVKNDPLLYQYNFAGSVAFDALVTFSGSNITQLIGVFPGQALKNRDGTWIDPDGQYFVNKAVSAFKKIYYDALEGIFGTVDMQTDAALEKMHLAALRNRDTSEIDPTNGKIPNVIYARAIHPFGGIDLISSDRPKTTGEISEYRDIITVKMDYADNVVNGDNPKPCFGTTKGNFLLDNMTFIIYAKCSIQTLLMLYAYTDIVTYYTDMKSILGLSDKPYPTISKAGENIKIRNKIYPFTDPTNIDDFVADKNNTIHELVKEIEAEKSEILEILRKFNRERDFYEENRYKNTKMRPPKSMIQRKEYYNMVPLYAQTCCIIKFTEKDLEKYTSSNMPISMTPEFHGIIQAMFNFDNVVKNYVSSMK